MINEQSCAAPTISPHGIFVINADGTIRYCNDVLLRWIGTTPVQSRGQPITQFLADFPTDFDIALATTEVEPKILEMRLLNGGVEPVQITARPLLPEKKASLVVIIERVD